MTFLFEEISTDMLTYVNAPDLYHAIEIFESNYDITDDEKYHIYVRIN